MVEQYNDGNEVSALINSPERKLPRLPSPSMLARIVSSHESFNETTASGSPAKPTFLPAWRSPGSPLITARSRLNVDVYSARRKFAKRINDCYVLRAFILAHLSHHRFEFSISLARHDCMYDEFSLKF